MLKPSMPRSIPCDIPARYAREGERVAPMAMFPGRTITPFLTRMTLPPSWSSATKGGTMPSMALLISRIKDATWVGDEMFRANSATPPACLFLSNWRVLWRMRLPPKPTMSNWPTFSSMDMERQMASTSGD